MAHLRAGAGFRAFAQIYCWLQDLFPKHSLLDVNFEQRLSIRASRIPRPTRSRAQIPAVKLWARKRILLCLVAVSIRRCAMKCWTHTISQSTRRGDRYDRAPSRMMRVRNMMTLSIVMMSMNLSGGIVAISILVIAVIAVPFLIS